MKRNVMCAASVLLALMLLSALPAAAENGEDVLTSLTHSTYGAAAKSGAAFTFSIPYADAGKTISLSGMTYGWTGEWDDEARRPVPDLDRTGIKVGETATLKVTYYYEENAGSGPVMVPYTTAYTVKAEGAAYRAPEFTGELSKTVSAPGRVSFQESEFTAIFQNNDSAGLTGISITGVNQSLGRLMYGTAEYQSGTVIERKNIGQLQFEANALTSDTSTVTYVLTGHYIGVGGAAETVATTLTISGKRTEPETLSLGQLKHNTTLSLLSARAKLDELCRAVTGNPLRYITITPPATGQGALYAYYGAAGARVLTASDRIYYDPGSGEIGLKDVTFVPKTGYNGTVTIGYRAVSAATQMEYSAAMSITVIGDVAYATDTKTPVRFAASDFSAVCGAALGATLDYVTFTLPSKGTLYLDYVNAASTGSKVAAGTRYYRSGSPSLSNVTYVPASGAGAVEIAYTAVSGTSSYTGKVVIDVKQADQTQIVYATDGVTPVKLNAADFNTACASATGRTLSYVWFSTVSASYGRLYYNYASASSYDDYVRTNAAYYRSTTTDLRIDSISFVPSTDTNATMTFPYTGYNDQGTAFTGTVVVSMAKTSETNLNYTIDNQTNLPFSAADFNSASLSATGYTLSYLKFSNLPASGTQGTIYYEYDDGAGTSVGTGDSYYRAVSTSTRAIGGLTFVPKSSYTGTVTLNYTGYATNGGSFSGKVQITVTAADQNVIRYSTTAGIPVSFRDADFNAVCKRLNGNRNLNYVRFTLPASSKGKLYHNYVSAASPGTSVTASTKYYREETPYLSNLTFVPASGYTGSVTIEYTGYDTGGGSFGGEILVTVGRGAAGTVSYRAGVGESIPFSASDFQSVCTAYSDENLSYVTFSLPSASYGVLYYNYGTSSSAKVTANTKYYRTTSPSISAVTFVPNASYNGRVTIGYTGYTADDTSYSGKVELQFYQAEGANLEMTSVNGAPVSFSAAAFHSACQSQTGGTLDYVTFTLPAAASGVLYSGAGSSLSYVTGGTRYYYTQSPSVGAVSFSPASGFRGTAYISYTGSDTNGYSYSGVISVNVTRAEETGSQYFSDVDEAYVWAVAAIDDLHARGVVNGVGGDRFHPGGNITRGDFILMLYRAFQMHAAVGQGSQFTDVPSGSYYYDAVLTARALGIAQGDGGRFRPMDAITREDAMVLTLRALGIYGANLSAGTAADISAFQDRALISDYAEEAVATLVKAGLVQGSDGRINPRNSMSRAEMAVFLDRIMQ